MLINAETLAYGRWPEILSAAGVDSAFLTGRNGPCPFCPDGGKDRFQFQNKGGGRYVCRHCTDGKYRSGFDFLMRHLALQSFVEAADYVRGYFRVNNDDVDLQRLVRAAREAAAKDQLTPEKIAWRVAKMQRLWDQSRPVVVGDPVDLYLRRRLPKLAVVPHAIHIHEGLEYWDPPTTRDGRPTLRGRYPGMLVRGFDPQGNLVQLHKTFLTRDGHKADVPIAKKTDVGVGCNTFAFELDDPTGDTLGVSEGVETALGATIYRHDVPVWPCGSSGILANFVLPVRLRGQVKKLIIYEDNDPCVEGRRAGQEAGSKLADRCRKQGMKSMIVRPSKVGHDMADHALTI